MACQITVVTVGKVFDCSVHGRIDTDGPETEARAACRKARAEVAGLCWGCFEPLEADDLDPEVNSAQDGRCLLCNCR